MALLHRCLFGSDPTVLGFRSQQAVRQPPRHGGLKGLLGSHPTVLGFRSQLIEITKGPPRHRGALRGLFGSPAHLAASSSKYPRTHICRCSADENARIML